MKSKTKAAKTKRKTSTSASTAMNPPPPPSESPSETLKLGRVVTIADRLRWIRIPKQGNQKKDPKQSFEFWPGIIYKSYNELMQDVKSKNKCSTKLQTQCFLRRQKQQQQSRENGSSNLSTIVGIVFFGDSYGLREFEDCALTKSIIQELNDPNNPNMDDTGDTRIQAFYSHYEDHYNFGIEHNSGSLDKERQGSFDNAIQRVLSLLGEQEEEDDDNPFFVINEEFYHGLDSCEARNALISPDGFDGAPTRGLVEVSTVTVNNKKKKKAKVISRSIEEECHVEDNVSAGDSHFSGGGDQNNGHDEIVNDNDEHNHDLGCRSGHSKVRGSEITVHHTQSPNQMESSSLSGSEISMIRPTEPWKDVWYKMKEMGWSWKWTKDDRAYFFGKDATEFLSQEEIEEFAEREFGWIKPRPIEQGRRRKRTEAFTSKPESKRKKTKEQNKTPPKRREIQSSKNKGKGNKKKLKKKSSSSKRTWGIGKGSGDLNFTYVWRYLKDQGWTHVKPYNPLHDWYYLKPGVKRGKKNIIGVEGEDYFITSNDLLHYIQRNDHLLGSPATSSTESESGMETTPTNQGYPDDSSADKSSNSGTPNSVGNDMYATPNGKHNKTSDLDESFRSCSSDLDESHWWLSTPIPHFSREVWPLLKTIIPYKNGSYIVTKNGKDHRMSSVKEMQIFLSINGLELNESHGFDKSDLETLSRWISLAQLPVKMDGKSLHPENSLIPLDFHHPCAIFSNANQMIC